MTGVYGWLGRAEGTALCRVTGVLPVGFLNACAKAGVAVLAAEAEGETSLLVTLRLRDVPQAEALAARSQCELAALRSRGGPVLRRKLLRRIVPAACLLLVFGLLAWSKLYIWEMEVTGNETVSSARILSALADCGVAPGTFWPGYTSDNLRSELLLKLPELAWATVNIHGSRAEVIVRERVPKPEIYRAGEAIDLVADHIGFVTAVQALNGTAAVGPGSAVVPGDVLIAGYADSAFGGARDVHALGTVTAETYYELTACAPSSAAVAETAGGRHSRWALLIGKKRVNFYRNSSICRGECDKIVQVWECKVQSLFTLPLALVREEEREYVLADSARDMNLTRRTLELQLHDRLVQALDGRGSIAEENYSCCVSDGNIVVCLRARCSQTVGIEQKRVQEDDTT